MSRDWRPIDSAPRDGRPVLIYGGKYIRSYHRKPLKADDPLGSEFANIGVAVYHNGWIDDRFPWVGYQIMPAREENVQTSHEPTHWMPLPDYPKRER